MHKDDEANRLVVIVTATGQHCNSTFVNFEFKDIMSLLLIP